MALDDTFKEPLSGCPLGQEKPITGTAWNSLTNVHTITKDDALDSVYLDLANTTATEVEIALVLNTDDNSTQANVDAATRRVLVPPKASKWALEGHAFRKHTSGSNTITVGAYFVTGSSGDVHFLGWCSRLYQEVETA